MNEKDLQIIVERVEKKAADGIPYSEWSKQELAVQAYVVNRGGCSSCHHTGLKPIYNHRENMIIKPDGTLTPIGSDSE